MLLREAKAILRRNGYELVEDFKSDAAEYKTLAKKADRLYNIMDKYNGWDDGNGTIDLNDTLRIKISGGHDNAIEVSLIEEYKPYGYGRSEFKTIFSDSVENVEDILQLLPVLEKRAVKAMIKYIDVENDDVDIEDEVAKIKEKISDLKQLFNQKIKSQHRYDRLQNMYYGAREKSFSARNKALDTWKKENPIKVGNPVKVRMKSGKVWAGVVSGETTDKKTGSSYWQITRDSDNRKYKLNKDKNKREEAIILDASSYDDEMRYEK